MNDKNILYGGDFEDWSNLNSPSVGALIISKLKSEGSSEKSFVSEITKKFLISTIKSFLPD